MYYTTHLTTLNYVIDSHVIGPCFGHRLILVYPSTGVVGPTVVEARS